ncbi:MAG: GAF domain-containing protein, partial [Anaerolineae bacterium]
MRDAPNSVQDAPNHRGSGHALRDIQEQLQSSQKRAAQLAAVNHIARVLNTILDVDQVYTTFASQIRQVLAYDWIGLGLLNEQGQTVLHLAMGQPLAGWRPGHTVQVDDIPLAWASHHERALLRQDLFSSNLVHHFAQDTLLTDAGLRTDVTVPLFLKDRCIGSLMLASQEQESYTADDLQILRQAVEQLAIAVENARLYEQERKQAQDLVEISKLVRDAASVLDIERQLEIIGQAQSLFARGTLGIGLLDGSDVRWYKPVKTIPADIASLVKQVLATGRSQSWVDNPQGPAMLAVPLHMAGQTKGVMTLYSAPGEPLGHAELNLLETLAAQASVTLDNTRLIEMTMHQGALLEQRANRLAHILDTSYDVLRLSPQTRDLEAQICTIAQEALGFQVVAIYVLNAQAGTLSLRAVAGSGLTAQDRRALCSQTYPLSELDKLLHPRFRISHSYYLRHGDRDTSAVPITPLCSPTTPWLGEGYWHPQDMLLAPIETPAGRAVGYFVLSQPQDSRAPTLETVQTVEILVNQAAIALENARLFAALEERLNQARRVNELGALNRLSTAVTSSLQVDSILNAAHQEIGRTLRPALSAIWLLQPTQRRPQADLARPNVIVHASQNGAPDLSLLVPPEVIETAVRDGTPIRLDGRKDSQTSSPPDLHDDDPGCKLSASALLAPMIVRDQKIGLIGAFAVQEQTFDDRDLALLHSMASTVAIAIENARLYAESKAFAKELAASQAQLLQSTKLAATGKLARTIALEINNPLQALQSC